MTCSIGIAASDTLGIWGEPLLAQADAAGIAIQAFPPAAAAEPRAASGGMNKE